MKKFSTAAYTLNFSHMLLFYSDLDLGMSYLNNNLCREPNAPFPALLFTGLFP